jgi:hypothetical protein
MICATNNYFRSSCQTSVDGFRFCAPSTSSSRVGCAETGAEALKAIQRFKSGVAIIGSEISDPDAREIAAIVLANFPHTALCFLANDVDQSARFGTQQMRAERGGRVKVVINERSLERLSE